MLGSGKCALLVQTLFYYRSCTKWKEMEFITYNAKENGEYLTRHLPGSLHAKNRFWIIKKE